MAPFTIASDDLPIRYLSDQGCWQQSLPLEIGRGQSKIYRLDEEMAYIETDYSPVKNLAVLNRTDADEPRMVVTFGLQGCSSFFNDGGGELLFASGYTTITTFSATSGKRQYQAEQCSRQLRLSLSKTFLEQQFGDHLIDRLFRRTGMRLVSRHPMSNFAVMAARQLSHCRLQAELKPAFMRGIAIATVADELDRLLRESEPAVKKYLRGDRDKAEQARDILAQEFRDPPTVAQLARRVGTNQLKLKQLFHHYFNNTPYGVLHEIRMKNAWRLLASGRYPVDSVANRVGYRHASNFSAAFTKYFGLSPSRVGKR
ncbi:helix-turn-helix domain-containing protein [Methylomarinum vadi]|uniref:helix-turn-helix domain-containing protein n=1 Tax=Methylomarinum vadi TaxID=438855 RepID=UPI0004DFC792|nr:AraC family transcriptional regulator [Methylomarinum vadi]